MLLLAGILAGALYNPWTGPQTREKILDMIAGDDDLQPLETFDAPRRRTLRGRAPRRPTRRVSEDSRRGGLGDKSKAKAAEERELGTAAGTALAAGERPLQRARNEAAGRRDVLGLEEHRPSLSGGDRGARWAGEAVLAEQVRPPGRERDILGAPPGDEERVRRHDAVVPVPEQVDRVDLEVEVRRAALGVARVADEAEHVAGPHALPAIASGE